VRLALVFFFAWFGSSFLGSVFSLSLWCRWLVRSSRVCVGVVWVCVCGWVCERLHTSRESKQSLTLSLRFLSHPAVTHVHTSDLFSTLLFCNRTPHEARVARCSLHTLSRDGASQWISHTGEWREKSALVLFVGGGLLTGRPLPACSCLPIAEPLGRQRLQHWHEDTFVCRWISSSPTQSQLSAPCAFQCLGTSDPGSCTR
jgi:hypothetical protein